MRSQASSTVGPEIRFIELRSLGELDEGHRYLAAQPVGNAHRRADYRGVSVQHLFDFTGNSIARP